MKATLELPDGTQVEATSPYPGADFLRVEHACPVCGDMHEVYGKLPDGSGEGVIALGRVGAIPQKQRALGELRPPPKGMSIRMPSFTIDHDRYTGGAICQRCKCRAGFLTVEVESLFGIDEDIRVLHGRPRVY